MEAEPNPSRKEVDEEIMRLKAMLGSEEEVSDGDFQEVSEIKSLDGVVTDTDVRTKLLIKAKAQDAVNLFSDLEDYIVFDVKTTVDDVVKQLSNLKQLQDLSEDKRARAMDLRNQIIWFVEKNGIDATYSFRLALSILRGLSKSS